MQKVLDFLEKHVQWVAIGIAALFLAYALYSYLPVVSQPVKAEWLGAGSPASPSEVEPQIYAKAEEVKEKMDRAQAPRLTVPNFVEQFNNEVKRESPRAGKLPAFSSAFNATIKYPPGWDPDAKSTGVAGVGNLVEVLPILPSPIMQPPATTGFAQVNISPAGVGGAPAAPAGGEQTVDTTWVRVPFSIPMGAVSAAFRNANIPNAFTGATGVLRVELIRQKQLPGNEWGPEELVAPFPHLGILPFPPTGNKDGELAFNTWAFSAQTQIVQPEFYSIIAGSDPRFTQPEPVDPVAAAFDPETFPPNGDLNSLTPEQRQQVLEVRRRRAREAEQNRPRPGAGGGGGGRPGRGGGIGGGFPYMPFVEPAPLQTASDVVLFLQPVRAAPGGGFRPAVPNQPPMDPAAGAMPTLPAEVPQVITVNPTPNAPFDPSQVPNGQIDGWAYDTTATAGSTYRYRIRYTMRNPIYNTQNVAASQPLAETFALIGGEQNPVWSDPITIAPLTHVFLAGPAAGTTVRFTIYRWQNGKRHRMTAAFGFGDPIGRMDTANGVDFRTPWTLVEVRRDSSSPQPYAVLMNADGVVRRQDFDSDSRSAEKTRLDVEVDVGVAPLPQGGPGMPPGMPPGVGGFGP